jgi:hypothetical protein
MDQVAILNEQIRGPTLPDDLEPAGGFGQFEVREQTEELITLECAFEGC